MGYFVKHSTLDFIVWLGKTRFATRQLLYLTITKDHLRRSDGLLAC